MAKVSKEHEKQITPAYIKSRLDYDPLTGILTWKRKPGEDQQTKAWNGRQAGKPAGCLAKTGYIQIWIDDIAFLAHRVIWAHQTGSWPIELIDHKDRNPSNNIWSNLREATYTQNQWNKTSKCKSGHLGIRQDPNSFRVGVTRNGKDYRINGLKTLEEAIEARDKLLKKIEIWGTNKSENPPAE